MEKVKISVTTRQITLFFALFAPLAKLFIMPASYTYYAGKDAWLCVLFVGVLEILALISLLYVLKNDGRAFADILSESLGKVGKKVVFCFLAAFYLLKAVVPIAEQLLISYEVLYESTPKLVFFIPIFIAMFYSSYSGFGGLFRVVELFAPFVIFSLLGIGFLSLSSVDLLELLPAFEYGVYPSGTAIFADLLWFGDFMLLLPLFGQTERAKKPHFIAIGYFVGIFIVAAFLAITVGIFGPAAARQVFMISKISKYSIAFSNLGRIDFLFIIVLFLGATLYSCTLFSCAVWAIKEVVPVKKHVVSGVLCVIFASFSLATLLKTYAIIEFLQRYALVLFLPVNVLVPTAIPILSYLHNKNEKSSTERT